MTPTEPGAERSGSPTRPCATAATRWRHQFTEEQVRAIGHALDAAGVQVIEVTHGDGLGGSSFNYGFSLDERARTGPRRRRRGHSRQDRRPAAARRRAHRGSRQARTTRRVGGADRDPLHRGRRLHPALRGRPRTGHGDRRLPDALPPVTRTGWPSRPGSWSTPAAQCVYVVDSAGALVLDDAQARVHALVAELGDDAQVGFHGHQNLSLGVANSVAGRPERRPPDRRRPVRLGAGAGNAPTEILAAVFERLGIHTGVDVDGRAGSRRGRRPTDRPPPAVADRAAITRDTRRLLPASCCTPNAPPSGTASRPTRSCSGSARPATSAVRKT